MKKTEFLVSAVLICAALATGCGQKAGPASPAAAAPAASAPDKTLELNLFALDVGTSENSDGTVTPLTQFLPAEKIVASLRTRGAANAVPVTAKLIAMSNGEIVGELKKDLTLTGAATTNLEFVRQGAGNWALGRYVVEVTIDGKPVGRQEIEVTQTLPEGARPKTDAKA
ncbi:hypothetical protein [Lysobacter gummosus]|jgi:hypothetical protein|uniref:Lipoprotein n=1 Tax=Lysobacter gummosus TaxID=262324 RepID=A0ABY3X9Y6_9GAMM|nr:hypothetical protein [Lysobacter gummosus]UNP28425.1 hypothetical protein MOV92_18260 [Lysobacter gummosus]